MDKTEIYTDYSFIKYKFLISTFNRMDIMFIKSVLIAENVKHFVQGEDISSGTQPMLVMVEENKYEQAKEIIKDLKLTITQL